MSLFLAVQVLTDGGKGDTVLWVLMRGSCTQYTFASAANARWSVVLHSPPKKRFASQEILPGPMQRMAMRPRSMQKSVRPSCMAGQNP
jgi:hypothetical protein